MESTKPLESATAGDAGAFGDGNFREDPAPPNADPEVTEAHALEIASEDEFGSVDSRQPTLVLFSSPGVTNPDGTIVYDHVLVWDVVEAGCFSDVGGALPPDESSPSVGASPSPSGSREAGGSVHVETPSPGSQGVEASAPSTCLKVSHIIIDASDGRVLDIVETGS